MWLVFYPPTSRWIRRGKSVFNAVFNALSVEYGKLLHAWSDQSPGGATIFNKSRYCCIVQLINTTNNIVDSITNCWWINTTILNSFDVIWLFPNCVFVSIHLVLRTRWILIQTQMRNYYYYIKARCVVSILNVIACIVNIDQIWARMVSANLLRH